MIKWTACIDLQNKDGLVCAIVNYEKNPKQWPKCVIGK